MPGSRVTAAMQEDHGRVATQRTALLCDRKTSMQMDAVNGEGRFCWLCRCKLCLSPNTRPIRRLQSFRSRRGQQREPGETS